MGMSVIFIEMLSLGYGDVVIIEELNLIIFKGEIIVFIGSNGCGKLIFLCLLVCLMKLRGGLVLLEGRVIVKFLMKEVVKEFVILLQGFLVLEGLIVYQLVK